MITCNFPLPFTVTEGSLSAVCRHVDPETMTPYHMPRQNRRLDFQLVPLRPVASAIIVDNGLEA